MLLSRQANRKYSTSQLKNGLEYALITCPDAQKASVSISIAMGHFSDPDDCQGLSHLMEHMFFAGSENFPDGNHLNQLLNTHGGFVNAWTSAESCNFHFDCPMEFFTQSLDVLIDMLTQPSLSLEGITQEVNAIDAEFSMRKQDDVRRLYDVHKQTCNPKHPFSRFNVGNKTIFTKFSADELKKKLTRHHNDHFVSEKIKACIVLPKHAADENLIASIESRLTAFRQQSNSVIKAELPALYLPEQKACLIEVKPYKFAQNLMLTFCLPNVTKWYRSKPILLMTHLIEDTSENSVQHYLKRRGLILELTANGGIEGDNFQDININLRLTEKGLLNTQEVISIVMQWFEFLRQNGIEKWRFEEKSLQLLLQVKHAPLPSGIDEAVMLATRMHKNSVAQALDFDVKMDIYDPDVYQSFFSYFVIDNLRVFCIHPSAYCDQETLQYEVPYSSKDISFEVILDKPIALELPAKNPYMSDNFNLVEKELGATEIKTIKHSDFLLKYSQNYQFKTPKGDCYLSIENPNMIGSARHVAIKKLWIACLSEQLSEAYSGAEMAGINFRLYGHQGGMTLHTSGFSDRQLMLCEEILSFIQTVNIKPAIFAGVKEKMVASLKNTLLNKPINQLFADLNILLQENTFSQEAILQEVTKLELAELHEKVSLYFHKIHIEGLAVGNWSTAQITMFHSKVLECFKNMDKVLKSSRNIAQITHKKFCVQHKRSHDEHAIVLYFQSSDKCNKNRALCIAIEKLLSPIVFDELRNKRNLGYLVGCGYFPVNKRPGLAIYVQSPSHSSEVLHEAIRAVLKEFIENIADFEPIFDNLKLSLMKQFKVSDANTNQLAQRLWLEFDDNQETTDSNDMSEVINQLSFDVFKEGCEQLLHHSALGVVAFVTESISTNDKPFAGYEFIGDPSKFKDKIKYQ